METPETLDLFSALVPFTLIVFLIAIGVVLLNQQFRKNLYKQQLEKETLKIKHQEKILQTSLEVQENERKRIAMDLHDELGAALSIARMQLLQLERSSSVQSEQVCQIRNLIEGTLTNTRRISHELMPLNLAKLGLEKTIKSLLSQVEKTEALSARLETTADTSDLPEFTQLALYRIFSELVNNTLKYASASEIVIRLSSQQDVLSCHYADNGCGLTESRKIEGLGFKSITNRIHTLGGKLHYGNAPQGGFYCEFSILFISKTP